MQGQERTVNADSNNRHGRLGVLVVAALGVVYGDIGTSPLYAFKEAFAGAHGLVATEANVLATLSMLFWALTLIVSIKYVWFVLKYDNESEGGVLALTALAHRLAGKTTPWSRAVIATGVFAAALFYGDAVITPATSVLSAIEGLSVAAPRLEHMVLPLTAGILVALFVIEKHGTGFVGRFFGPITCVWFLTLAVLGAISIAETTNVNESRMKATLVPNQPATNPPIAAPIVSIADQVTDAIALAETSSRSETIEGIAAVLAGSKKAENANCKTVRT